MRNKGFAGVALSRACVCFEEYCCAVKERNFVKHLNFVRRKEKGDTQESNLHSFMDEIRLPSTSSTSITNQIFCLLSIDPSLGFLHWRCCYYDSYPSQSQVLSLEIQTGKKLDAQTPLWGFALFWPLSLFILHIFSCSTISFLPKVGHIDIISC